MRSFSTIWRSFIQAVILLGTGISFTHGEAAEAVSKPMEARIGKKNGWNTIFVDGSPMPPLMYSGTEHSRKTWTEKPRQSLKEFTALGYEIIQTDFWLKHSLRADETFDMENIRKQLAGILEVNQTAKIVVRINVSAPQWWLDSNPEEICKVTADGPAKNRLNGNSSESLASEKYIQFAHKHLTSFLKELEKTPEGNHVIGFHIGGGVYGEWHYYGMFNEPDASDPMRRQFSEFAKNRYGSLEQINTTWGTAFTSFEELVVPSFDRRYEVTDGDFRDPQRDRYVIDYYECQQAVVSKLVNSLAKTTKETWPRQTIVGLFYGYLFGGWTTGAQAGQLDIQTLFNSPYVDYFSGPYASRSMHGSGMLRSLAESLTLRGKVWISEHDGGSHLRNPDPIRFPDHPRNESDSIARMRKNFMYTITENAGQWWYDFGPGNKHGRWQSGWWSTPSMLAEAEALLTLTKQLRETHFSRPADVLVIYDMTSFNYVRPAKVDQLTFRTTERLTDRLLGTGAAMDRIFLMDLPKVDLSRYQMVIFTNTFALTLQQRTEIVRQVRTAGTKVIFMSGAGYTDGLKNNPAFITELTGMKIEPYDDAKSSVTVRLGEHTSELDARGVTSRFKITDSAAQTIGVYHSGAIAAATGTLGNSQVYYFGVPMFGSLEFLKFLFRDAGIRFYVEGTVDRDYVSVGGGIIGISSVSGGKKTIIPLNDKAIEVNMLPLSTLYFDINSGKILTPEHD